MSPFALMQEIMDIVLVVANSAISLDFWILLIVFHFFLILICVGMEGGTICDMAQPLLGIFRSSAASILDGLMEAIMDFGLAVVFYIQLYVKSYLYTLIIIFFLLFTAIPALLINYIVLILATPILSLLPEPWLVMMIMGVGIVAAWWHFIVKFGGRFFLENLKGAFDCFG